MREHTWTFVLPVQPLALWDFLAEYENDMRIASKHASASLEDGAPGEVGAVYTARIGWEGRLSTFRVGLIAAERGVGMTWRSCTGASTGEARYVFRPADSGTEMDLHLSLTLREAFEPLEPFGWVLLSRCADTFVENLQALQLEDTQSA
jgi:hypothetical protein